LGVVDFLVGIAEFLPEIKKPEKKISFKEKMLWTLAALLIFFILGKITLIGLNSSSEIFQQLDLSQTIMASDVGTLITTGIGPIVMASIFLQLFVAARIININTSDPEGRKKFQSLQKIFAVGLCFIEGFIYVASGYMVPIGGVGLMNPVSWFLIFQIALGSLILLYLDEVVSKYGIGSGISLFIAAGVSSSIIWQIFRPPLDIATQPMLASGGIIANFMGTGDLMLLLPIVGVLAIFAVVSFAEGIHVNIPITMGHKGTGGRFPVKFLYVSNMPVILAMALFSNIRLWALFAGNIPILSDILKALSWAVAMPGTGGSNGGYLATIIVQGINSVTFPIILQGIIFLIILIVVCVLFGWFWVELGNQSTSAVAEQLERSGMQIPGFRKDKRVIEKVLERYIPPITIMGSIFVALLAGLGDMVLSTLSSGTGILLTVGIVHKFYEEIAKDQADVIGKLMGNE
jgi:preprotein translocase subunit SecY